MLFYQYKNFIFLIILLGRNCEKVNFSSVDHIQQKTITGNEIMKQSEIEEVEKDYKLRADYVKISKPLTLMMMINSGYWQQLNTSAIVKRRKISN
ncbi:putative segregation and condensation protein A [Trichinella spiralis]|uniref:putative segregation and condensation protein A n=1 Tax=Trichinella spiralis TaxID=6334 RepID=UPI0001EFB859|nr:putative segregation and condensation protein A [Trichinella spiralis]